MNKDKRTYVGELEWVIEEINCSHCDSNPNRAARIDRLLEYGLKVSIARRSKSPLPPRPEVENML